MIRRTGVLIDQPGNIWSINNWKPDFDIDVTSNPGGDGIVIFIALAAPPRLIQTYLQDRSVTRSGPKKYNNWRTTLRQHADKESHTTRNSLGIRRHID
jgi:hypothetical protein